MSWHSRDYPRSRKYLGNLLQWQLLLPHKQRETNLMMWQIKHPPDFLLKSSFRSLVWEGDHCMHFISKFNLCLRCELEELILRNTVSKKKKKVLTLEGIGMLMTVWLRFVAISELLTSFTFCKGAWILQIILDNAAALSLPIMETNFKKQIGYCVKNLQNKLPLPVISIFFCCFVFLVCKLFGAGSVVQCHRFLSGCVLTLWNITSCVYFLHEQRK